MTERISNNGAIDKYPVYFSLFQGKPIFLSNVETPMLKGAIERLLKARMVTSINVRKTDGSKDKIVRWKESKR